MALSDCEPRQIDRLRQKAQAIQRQIDARVEDLPIADRVRPSPLSWLVLTRFGGVSELEIYRVAVQC